MKNLHKAIEYLLYLLVFLLPFQTRFIYKTAVLNDHPWEYGTFSLYATELLMGVILFLSIIYALLVIKQKKPKSSEQTTKRLLLFFLFFAILGLNCFIAINSSIAFYKLSQLILAIALMFTIWFIKPSWEKFSWSIILSGLIQGSIAVQQFIAQYIPANKWLGIAEQNPETLGVPVIATETIRWLRSFGTLPHPNILAGFLLICLILTMSLFITTKTKKHQKVLPMIFAVMFLGLITTLSRGAILAFLIALIIFSYKLTTNKKATKAISKFALITIFIIIIFSVSFPNLIISRTMGNNRLEQLSNITRLNQYTEASEIIKNNWLVGTGLSNYTVNLYQSTPGLEGWQYQPIHNTYILIFSELGVLGFATSLLFILYLIYNLLAKQKWSTEQAAAYSCLAGLGITAMFDHYLWSFFFGLMLLSLALSLPRLSKQIKQ